MLLLRGFNRGIKWALPKTWRSVEENIYALNEDKIVRGVEQIKILGFEIRKGRIPLDSGRMQPLLDMEVPKSFKELKHVPRLIAYYAKWIADFSAKITPLTELCPMSAKATEAH